VRRSIRRPPEAKTPSADVDSLYGVPLGEFIRARNALAGRLRKAGQGDAAEAVKRLGKPSPPVWGINQAVRKERALATELIDAVDALRDAQATGSGDLAAATRAQRRALDRLVERAVATLEPAGFRASPEMRARIARTVVGAAAHRPDDLRAGRLSAELSAPGFEVFAGAPAPARVRPGSTGRPTRPARPSAPARARATARQAAAPDHHALARARLQRAETAREAAEAERQAASERVTRAEAAVSALREQLAAAERHVRTERRAAAQARRATERAGRAVARARAEAGAEHRA
jgi:hypothetical protein